MRERLESHLVRRASELVDEVGDERAEELASLLEEVRERRTAVAEAEATLEHLGDRLRELGLEEMDERQRTEALIRKLSEAERLLAERTHELEQSRGRLKVFEARLAHADELRAELTRRLDGLIRREAAVTARERDLASREASAGIS